MTEDEARKKWCPQARVATRGEDAAVNRWAVFGSGFGPSHGTTCIASECMAWRSTSSQHGYCGLAGRPRV